MTKIPNNKPVYDLEERTFQFAKAVRLFVKILPKTIANIEDGKQVVKASGNNLKNAHDAQDLIQEANELKKIFSSILENQNSLGH